MITQILRTLAHRRSIRARLAEVEEFRPGPRQRDLAEALLNEAAGREEIFEHVGGVANG